jgi:hypothetical protein
MKVYYEKSRRFYSSALVNSNFFQHAFFFFLLVFACHSVSDISIYGQVGQYSNENTSLFGRCKQFWEQSTS